MGTVLKKTGDGSVFFQKKQNRPLVLNRPHVFIVYLRV